MKIRTKITLLIVFLAAIFLASLFIYLNSQRGNFVDFFRSEAQNRKIIFDKIFALEGASAKSLAFDYTYWDEMVNYLTTRQRKWAKENIDSSLEKYRVDAAWIYDGNGEVAYSVNRWGKDAMAAIPLPPEVLRRFMAQLTFSDFFVKTPQGIFEIHGAPIQAGSDLPRVTPAHGYFLAGKAFHQEYLDDLSELIQSPVTFVDSPFLDQKKENFSPEEGRFVFFKSLPDWNGTPIGFLKIFVQSSSITVFNTMMRQALGVFLVLIFVLALVAFLAIIFWILWPLKKISLSLGSDNLEHLEGLKMQHDEFGDIARLVGEFFAQREEARESEKRYRLIFETAGNLIITISPDGIIMDCNKRSLQVLGYTPEEVIGQSIAKILLPEFFPRAQRAIAEIMARGFSENNEYKMAAKDGRVIDASVSSSVLREEMGGVVRIISIIEDISRRKSMETALIDVNRDLASEHLKLKDALADVERRNRELQETQAQFLQSSKMAAIGQLSAGVAHEIKNPLAIIVLGIEKIEKLCDPANAQIKEFLRMVKDATARANNVVIELLNFSRYTGIDLKPVDVHQAIRSALLLVQDTASAKGIEVRLEASSPVDIIEADAILLEQVFVNLLTNAIDAIDKQGGLIFVRTSFKKEGDGPGAVVIEFIDNGAGIPEEIKERIFDPFFTTKGQGEGTGLGLSIVFMIMEKHRGTVQVESAQGAGTKITLTVPVKVNISEKKKQQEYLR